MIRLAERRYQAVSLFYKEDNEFIISFFFKLKKIYLKKNIYIYIYNFNFFFFFFLIFFKFFFLNIFKFF